MLNKNFVQVVRENKNRHESLDKSLLEFKTMKEARMKIYQEEINATIAQHDVNVQNIALLNNEIEKQAKSQWQQDCTTIMEENNCIVENIRKDWEAKMKEIKENNALLAMKRIEYQVNISLSTMLIDFVTIYLGLA